MQEKTYIVDNHVKPKSIETVNSKIAKYKENKENVIGWFEKSADHLWKPGTGNSSLLLSGHSSDKGKSSSW